jgi:hypothetical protein
MKLPELPRMQRFSLLDQPAEMAADPQGAWVRWEDAIAGEPCSAGEMRAEFWKWVDECGCDTDGAWSAWQACWNLLNPAKSPQNPATTEGG